MAGDYGSFDAFAFHPDFGNEAVAGKIVLSTLSLTFRAEDTVFEIPHSHLLARLEEGEERIIFQDSHRPELVITTSDMGVLDLTHIAPIARLSEQVNAKLTRREVSRRVKIVLWFCAGSALVLWLGMIAVGAMVRSIVARVPPEAEKIHGDLLLSEVKSQFQFEGQTNAALELAMSAQPLLRTLPGTEHWQFHVADEETPNAFAIPGGHIVFTTGMLKLAERPEELLGVIAHETAHVLRKHSLRQQIASAGPILVFEVFLRGRGGAMSAVAGGSALLVTQSFSQEYEKEADDMGWDYLVSANIDPRGMIEIFRKLKAWEANSKHREILPKAFSSHPDLDKRIARLESKWRRLPKKSDFLQLDSEPAAHP